MIIIVFLWLGIVLIGIKRNKNVGNTVFTEDNSIALRGICSIEIMMGHLGIATESIVLFPNRKAGILFVGVFFALSGYGLMYSIANKDDYLVDFLPKRIGKLLFPAYIVFLISIVLDGLIDKGAISLIEFFNLKYFFLRTNWYVWELLILYIVFYISVKKGKIEKTPLIIFYFSIVFVCIAYALKFENPWYGSTLCFGLGIFYFSHRDQFEEIFIMRNPAIKFISCCLVMTISIGLYFVRGGVIGLLFSRNIASIFFVIVLIVCLYRVSIGNKVSIWLGRYSYEIFLFHPLFINILRPWIKNNVIYSLMVIGFTVMASYLYGICEAKIKNIVGKI